MCPPAQGAQLAPEPKSPLQRYLERLVEKEGEHALVALAKRAGTSVRYLWVVARGEKAPMARTMRGIFEATEGRVTYRQLVEWSPGLDQPSRRVGRSTILEARSRRSGKRRQDAAA